MSNLRRFGKYSLHTEPLCLKIDREIVNLTHRQLDSLFLIVQANGKPVAKSVFFAVVWGGAFVEEGNLTQTIFLLRKTLGKLPDGGEYIETLARHGYRLSPAALKPFDPEPVALLPASTTAHDNILSAEAEAPVLPARARVPVPEILPPLPPADVLPDVVLLPVTPAALKWEQSTLETPFVAPVICVPIGAGPQAAHVFAGITPLGMIALLQCEGVARSMVRIFSPDLPSVQQVFVLSRRISRTIATVVISIAVSYLAYVYLHRSNFAVLAIKQITRDGIPKPINGPLTLRGEQVLFTEALDGKKYLAEVSVQGGDVTRGASVEPETWSVPWLPAPSQVPHFVAEARGDPPWINLSDLEVRSHSPDSLAGASAAWSPDGKRLAYIEGHDLLVSDASGGGVRTLSHSTGIPYWPSWSPDNKTLRFTEDEGGSRKSIWQVSATGGDLHYALPPSDHQHRACCGSWSADGKSFVYIVEGTYSSSIWMSSEASSFNPFHIHSEWEVASGPVDFWRSPLLSPDSASIYALGEGGRGELRNISGSASGQTTPYENQLSADTVTFSHDGKWIAYSLYPQGTIWRSRLDGTRRVQLSTPGSIARYPQWAPDDKTLLFVSTSDNTPWQVERVLAGGGAPLPLLPNNFNQGTPTYSPDGKSVAFGQSRTFGDRSADQTVIAIVDLRTGKTQELPGSKDLWTARWSPHADLLAAVSVDRKKLMLYDFTQKQWSELASYPINDILWSKDGSTLYFDTMSGDNTVLYAIRLADRKVASRVSSFNSMQRTGFFGSYLSLGADGEVLLLKHTGSADLYRLQIQMP